MHGVNQTGKNDLYLYMTKRTVESRHNYCLEMLILKPLHLILTFVINNRFLDVVKGTAKIKISSKKEGDEFEADGYCASLSSQNEDASKDTDIHTSASGSEGGIHTHQHIQRSSEVASGQQQNQNTKAGTKSSNNGAEALHQQEKLTPTSATNQSPSVTHTLPGGQPKDNVSCTSISSHDIKSSHQLNTSPTLKQAASVKVSTEASNKTHSASDSSALELSNVSASSSSTVPASSSSVSKSSSGNASMMIPPYELQTTAR